MLEKEWTSVSFGHLDIETRDGEHHFRVEVIFGGVDPQAVQVELFAAGPEEPTGSRWPGGTSSRTGREVTCLPPRFRRRGPQAISPLASSLIFSGVAVPLEMPLILWHH